MTTYRTENHAKFLLRYHMIFVTKYRRRILIGAFGDFVKSELVRISERADSEFSIRLLETDKDHAHMMVESSPRASPLSIVRRLKQMSTVSAWKSHGDMLCNVYFGERTLWSDGYFVCTTGDANTRTILEYIRNQG